MLYFVFQFHPHKPTLLAISNWKRVFFARRSQQYYEYYYIMNIMFFMI